MTLEPGHKRNTARGYVGRSMDDDRGVADLERIGTLGYLGLASFWDIEYEHYLQGVEPEVLVLVHRNLMEARLDITGVSLEHEAVILRTIHHDAPVILGQDHR